MQEFPGTLHGKLPRAGMQRHGCLRLQLAVQRSKAAAAVWDPDANHGLNHHAVEKE